MQFPIKTLMQLKSVIQSLRKRKGMTQQDIADILGIKQQAYARIESKPSSTSVEKLFQILNILDSDLIVADKYNTTNETTIVDKDQSPKRQTQASHTKKNSHKSYVIARGTKSSHKETW